MDSAKQLRDLSKVYMEAVYGGGKKEEKKDTRLVVTAADKKANTKAYQNYKAGHSGYKAADHLGEGIKGEDNETRKAAALERKAGKKTRLSPSAGKANAAKMLWSIRNAKSNPQNESVNEGKKADKDYDGDGKIESSKDEYFGSKDKAIKKAMGKEDKKKGHDCASKVKHEEYGIGNCLKGMHTLDEEGNVSHYDVLFEHGVEKNVKASTLEVLEGMYHEHAINHEKNQEVLDESESDEYIEIVREIKSAETQADIKRWKSLEESGKFTVEEIDTIMEADIADILARLEKKRISKGGDPDESPLGKKVGQAMKSQQDKARKKAGLKTEEIELDEAERDLGDRLHRKRKLYDRTVTKAMDFARREGEAAGHARYRMGQLDREMDKVKDKMKEKEKK